MKVNTACPEISASPAGITLGRSSVNELFWGALSREESRGGSEESCDECKVLYQVFKLFLMKKKYNNLLVKKY